jgi:hypothetical protein
MLTSALLLATILPFEITPKDAITPPLSRPVTVAAFVDSAKILGLPRLKLRDASGNRYIPNKAMMFEPAALVHQHAGTATGERINPRRAFIQGYLKR